MKWLFRAMLLALVVMSFGDRANSADDKDATAILDKAIKALGGGEKLSKVKAATWRAKHKNIPTDIERTTIVTVQGLGHFRYESERELDGRKTKVVHVVLAENKGWQLPNGEKREMDAKALAFQKRTAYLRLVPMTLVPLRSKSFKVEAAGEKQVGDKSAVGLKVTGPDGKDFSLYFDKDSGLPVLLVAKMTTPGGDEFTAETTFADYKEFGGIKIATRMAWKRDGEKYFESHITEFRVLDKIDPKTFEEPK